jgi:hypothetical protein
LRQTIGRSQACSAAARSRPSSAVGKLEGWNASAPPAVFATLLAREVVINQLHEKLDCYVELLEHAANPETRDFLQGLFLDEEARFGADRARLDQTETFIRQGRIRIEKQRKLLLTQGLDGPAAELARETLLNLLRTQSLFESYRELLLTRGGGDFGVAAQASRPSEASPGVR